MDPTIPFIKSFEEISKNEGIAFLYLDPSETKLQLLHRSFILGRSWSYLSHRLMAVLGFDHLAHPIQIIQKLVKDIKAKSHSMSDFTTNLDSIELFESMKSVLPVKMFLSLKDTTPYSVAQAFFDAMFEFVSEVTVAPVCNPDNTEPELKEEIKNDQSDDLAETQANSLPDPSATQDTSKRPKFLDCFIHIIQLCHLCAKGNIPPAQYSLATTDKIEKLYTSISLATQLSAPSNLKHPKPAHDNSSDLEDCVSSPDQKVSKMDHYLLNTVLKLHETLDKSNQKITQEKEAKEPGFHRLEPHQKNLVLNASAVPPYDALAPSPNDFYNSFLRKKSQCKAKEMITH